MMKPFLPEFLCGVQHNNCSWLLVCQCVYGYGYVLHCHETLEIQYYIILSCNCGVWYRCMCETPQRAWKNGKFPETNSKNLSRLINYALISDHAPYFDYWGDEFYISQTLPEKRRCRGMEGQFWFWAHFKFVCFNPFTAIMITISFNSFVPIWSWMEFLVCYANFYFGLTSQSSNLCTFTPSTACSY